MKNLLQRLLILLAIVLGFNQTSYGLVGGIYTIGGTGAYFTNLAAAINAVNATGISGGDVFFNIRTGSYTGSDWQGIITANGTASGRLIIQAESGNAADVTIDVAGTSAANYIIRLNGASFVTIRNLTFKNTNTSNGRILDFAGASSNDSVKNCVFTGATTTSSGDALAIIYAMNHTGTTNVFYKNTLNNGGTAFWWRGTSSASWTYKPAFIENTINQTNSGYYAFYIYNTSSPKVSKNIVNQNGTGVYYAMYMYYTDYDVAIEDNDFTINTTSTVYPIYMYYTHYVGSSYGASSNGSSPILARNKFKTNTTSGTTNFITYYNCFTRMYDNVFDFNSTTGGFSIQGPHYYAREADTKGNTFTFKATGSVSMSITYFIYSGGNTFNDTFQNNTVNMINAGGNLDLYAMYYGNTIIRNNTYNYTTTTGTVYNRIYYGQSANYHNNKVKIETTTGSAYGLYLYGTSSYAGTTINNNDIEINSTGSATHYTLYGYYMNGDKVRNNIFTTKTAGTSYGAFFEQYQNAGNRVFNNTFHSYGTGNTQYGLYALGGDINFYNNVMSRTNTVTNGYAAHFAGSGFKADYNLFAFPGTTGFTGTYSGTSLNDFRKGTSSNMNSLVHPVTYTNAANRDFTIDASSPNAWAVNGRGMHDTSRHTDRAAVAVPRLLVDGVPDIGAYEVEPAVGNVPDDAVASPTVPMANGTQVFTYGQDTVLAIDWGATVPTSYSVKQYTGVKAPNTPAGLQRGFMHVEGTPSSLNHNFTAYTFYKDPWIGDIPQESDVVMARHSGTGGWVGYNYTNALRETNRNIVSTVAPIDSIGSFTIVREGRIGIRCSFAPTGIRINRITAFSADINWDAIFNPFGYQVVVKKTNTPPTDSEWGASAFPTVNSLSAGGLDEDTQYFVFIRNVCGLRDTSGYTMDSFRTIITCHAPTITAVDVATNRAVVYWTAVKTAYNYEVALTKSSTPPTAGTAMNKFENLFSNIDEGTTYFAHVRALCNTMYEKSEWSTVEIRTWGVGVKDVNAQKAGMMLHPNPVKDVLNVTLSGNVSTGTITVLDVTGKQLQRQMVDAATVNVNVSELPAGVYILQYADEGRREQVKFTKQ